MKVIQKIIAPSNLCTEEYLTIWIADLEKEKQIWIQTSETENPHWERIGNLFEESIIETNDLDTVNWLEFMPKRFHK